MSTEKSSFFKIAAGFFIPALLCVLFAAIPVPDLNRPGSTGTIVLDRNGNFLRGFLNPAEQWKFSLDSHFKIPEKLISAVLLYEDRYFFFHHGVDFFSLGRALIQNLVSRRIISGASTITMQCVRMAGRHRKRTVPVKILEIFQAFKTEIFHNKSEILKYYLANAPYGGNTIGITAASWRYFGKLPDRLTWSEAAILAILPNSPGTVNPRKNPEALFRKKNLLLKKLLKNKILPMQNSNASFTEPAPSGDLRKLHVAAPHWCRRFNLSAEFKGNSIRSTIDLNLQQSIEAIARRHHQHLQTQGIGNVAAVVIHNPSREIRSYVGSSSFFNFHINGQVDGADAQRSTGSVLKPFLYALAFDSGLILPQTRLKDIPTYFGSFSPANADRGYSGLVSAEQALIRSLNVPAVRLLNAYGLNRFYRFLTAAGITSLFRKPDEYGLPLIIGGAEASLLSVCSLYCGLARGGKFAPLRSLADQSRAETGSLQLITPESVWLTLEILKDLKRPGAELYWDQYQSQYPVAWKTGTSYGQRDGWAVGVTPDWTVGVWTGNFSGEGNQNLSGAACSAPMMFAIFNHLQGMSSNRWFSKKNLEFRKTTLCTFSGYRAGPDCPGTFTVPAPGRAKPLRLCPFHKRIYLNLKQNMQVCSLCWTAGQYRAVSRLLLPPDVAQFMREQGHTFDPIPPHNPACPGLYADSPLSILYPEPDARLLIPRDFNGVLQKITLSAAHRQKGMSVFWYLDDMYIGKTRGSHKIALIPQNGRHKLTLTDGQGNRATRYFFVLQSSP